MVLSTVSADTPLKSLAALVDAMASVVTERPSAKLHVVGELRDGPAKAAIKRHALEDSIVFHGRLSQAELADLYRRAAVVAAPSVFEGFGLPTAEAMACGAAVVVTDGGALPEVAGDAGVVVPVGDAAVLGDAISALLRDEDRRRELGVRAVERARTRFSWRKHAQAAIVAYKEAGVRAHD